MARRQKLLPAEAHWRDRQPFLESKGYTLRPRLRPGWIASWAGKGESEFLHAEDNIYMVCTSMVYVLVVLFTQLHPDLYQCRRCAAYLGWHARTYKRA
jgi:hypothetical protein